MDLSQIAMSGVLSTLAPLRSEEVGELVGLRLCRRYYSHQEESVRTLALSLRNEAYAFILLHELGHVLYRHPGYRAGIPLEQVRKNEADADRFALMVLERADAIPMGMALWFMAQVNYMPSKGQLMAEGKVTSEIIWEIFKAPAPPPP